jgi:hypothetical protein
VGGGRLTRPALAPHRHRDGLVDPILDSLEAAKLITRVRNAADRRKINVFLTSAGAALEADGLRGGRQEARQQGPQPSRVAHLFALAGQIIENFKTLRAAGASSAKTDAPLAQKPRPTAAPRGRVRRNMPRAAE